MSEEIKPIEQTENTELAFSFVNGSSDEIQIKFADGVHILPEAVVRELGVDKLKETAPHLDAVAYLDFMKAFNSTMEKRNLNRIGGQFISAHFGRGF